MTYKPVPRNRFQQNMDAEYRRNVAPDPYATLESRCRIIEVYDPDRLNAADGGASIPRELVGLIVNRPGFVFAKIELPDGETMFLPFREPEDQLFATYGNSTQLEGRQATIYFRNLDIQSGFLVPQRYESRFLSLEQLASVLDLGNLI